MAVLRADENVLKGVHEIKLCHGHRSAGAYLVCDLDRIIERNIFQAKFRSIYSVINRSTRGPREVMNDADLA